MNQLEAKTYAVFPTAKEFKDAIKKAKELNLYSSIMAEPQDDSLYFAPMSKEIIPHTNKNGWSNSARQIPTTEFLLRMEGNWEVPPKITIRNPKRPNPQTNPVEDIFDCLGWQTNGNPEQLTLPEAIAKLEGEGWEEKDGELINTSRDYYLTKSYTKEWRAYFYSKATNLSVDDLENWKSNIEQAIVACETLNNAKQE